MRFVCLSDTHSRHRALVVPEGDVLLHAGDLTSSGGLAEIAEVDRWLGTQPHPHKLVIAGNHDFAFEREPKQARARLTHATYLEDAEVAIAGLRIWGSPWQPWFFDWAFNLRRGAPIRAKWDLIPEGIDVLLTHGPPRGVLDRTAGGEAVGCDDLAAAIGRLRPRAHVFGHIHEAAGSLERDGVLFVNASICDLGYRPAQPARVFDLEPGGLARRILPG